MRSPLEVISAYPQHDQTVNGLFESRMAAGRERPFLHFGDNTWSWEEFAGLAQAVARVLAAQGIGEGDRVAVIGRNTPWHVSVLLAATRLGAIMVPVNPEFRGEEIRYVLEHAGVSGIIASEDLLETVREAAGMMVPAPWLISMGEAQGDVPALSELTRDVQGQEVPRRGAPDRTCLIIYTSGTTGFPKGVMHSQRTYVLVSEASVQRVGLQESDRVMVMLPLFHVNALFYSTGGALAAGAEIVLVPRFSASAFWHTVADYRVTQVNVIESIGLILKARPRSEYRPDHRLRVVYGVRQNAADTFRREFNIPTLVSGYGMTEIPGAICTPMDSLDKPGTMGIPGRHPDPEQPWSECRIVDEEWNDVTQGDVGELIVRTPIVMQGYYRDPEQTRAAFREGWFLTGDLVRQDADGYYFFHSRKKDIIRRRGENISAAELERIIGENPDIGEVAALAVPSEFGEDEILAVVTPRPERPDAAAKAIAEWCRARLAANKTPRYVAFMDELPRTPTHKIAKMVLRQDETLRHDAVDLQREQMK